MFESEKFRIKKIGVGAIILALFLVVMATISKIDPASKIDPDWRLKMNKIITKSSTKEQDYELLNAVTKNYREAVSEDKELHAVELHAVWSKLKAKYGFVRIPCEVRHIDDVLKGPEAFKDRLKKDD